MSGGRGGGLEGANPPMAGSDEGWGRVSSCPEGWGAQVLRGRRGSGPARSGKGGAEGIGGCPGEGARGDQALPGVGL